MRNNPKRNPLSSYLKNFLINNQMELIDITLGTGPTYTYQHKYLPNSSYIDHIALLQNTNISFSSCEIHDLHSHNMSDHQPISVTINIDGIPTLRDIADAELPQNLIPAYAWNNKKFKELYKIEVRKNLVNINSENKNNENPLLIICDKLSKSTAKAFEICYKNRNAIAKKWWTQELNISKSILSKHFNHWKEAGFPKEINNAIQRRSHDFQLGGGELQPGPFK